jgi:hypothetical protein
MANKSSVPIDGNQKGLPLTPSAVPYAVTYDTTISGSTTVTLNASTFLIEVNAISQGIFMKWGATASSSAFDEYIQAGSTRHYVVPVNAATGVQYTTVQFIEQAASATLVVIEK